MSDEPVTLDVYLRSGQIISLRVTDWSMKRSAVDASLREFSWTMADTAQLPYLDLNNVAAIHERAPINYGLEMPTAKSAA